jgi:L-cysteine/cystine lyase
MQLPRNSIPALADNDHAFLNSGASGPPSRRVLEAIQKADEFFSTEAYVNGAFFKHLTEAFGSARGAAARLAGTTPENVALTQSTTHGMNLGIFSIDWSEGEEVISAATEHPGLLVPLGAAQKRYGLKVKLLEPPITSEEVQANLTDQTRLIALSHVDWTTGEVLPVEELSDLARPRGVTTLIDGAQSVGNTWVDIPGTGADIYAFTGHKWLLGPEGMGALYVRPDYTGHSTSAGFASLADPAAFNTMDGEHALFEGARRFEASTVSPALAAGFERAASDAAERGKEGAHEIRRLAGLLTESLAGLPKVKVISPLPASNGLVSFAVEGVEPAEAVQNLFERGFILRSIPAPHSHLRASVHLFNTEAELESLAEVVARL